MMVEKRRFKLKSSRYEMFKDSTVAKYLKRGVRENWEQKQTLILFYQWHILRKNVMVSLPSESDLQGCKMILQKNVYVTTRLSVLLLISIILLLSFLSNKQLINGKETLYPTSKFIIGKEPKYRTLHIRTDGTNYNDINHQILAKAQLLKV